MGKDSTKNYRKADLIHVLSLSEKEIRRIENYRK